MSERNPMTVDSVRELLETAGASVMARTGRSEQYSAPREFSFEVRSAFPNGLELHIVARQFTYRDPWEATGRVNDLVDASLLKDGGYAPLPKGYPFFQGTDEETGLDEEQLQELIECVRSVNPKLYELQKLTGDL
ncbi:MAG: hypothetical protein H6Q56_1933 [Deltaproteobacteria bacterium]|jgi:hypothetical protein|nr:hypothetical protein [Deltaproteobacteria bacterium]